MSKKICRWKTSFAVSVLLLVLFFFAPVQAGGHESININTANAEQLQELPGIGPALAERIIEYRQDKEFESKEDLLEVRGIGPGTLGDFEDMIEY